MLKKFYAYKFDNLDEIDQLLERWIQNLTWEELDSLNIPMSVKENFSLLRTFQEIIVQDQMALLIKYTKYLRKKIIKFSQSYIILHKNGKGGNIF